MSELFVGALKKWKPMCCVCGERVERFKVTEDAMRGTYTFHSECHGHVEEKTASSKYLNHVDFSAGLAFRAQA